MKKFLIILISLTVLAGFGLAHGETGSTLSPFYLSGNNIFQRDATWRTTLDKLRFNTSTTVGYVLTASTTAGDVYWAVGAGGPGGSGNFTATATINGLQPNSGIFTIASSGAISVVPSAPGTITINNIAPNYNTTTTFNGLSGAITGNIFNTTTTISNGVGISVTNGGIGATTITNTAPNFNSTTSINTLTGAITANIFNTTTTVVGTANQVTSTLAGAQYTLSLPQSIAPFSNVTFASGTFSGALNLGGGIFNYTANTTSTILTNLRALSFASSTNGVALLTLDGSNNRVGINTNSPAQMLDVVGSIRSTGFRTNNSIQNDSSANNGSIAFNSTGLAAARNVADTNTAFSVQNNATGSTGLLFNLLNSTSTTQFNISATGTIRTIYGAGILQSDSNGYIASITGTNLFNTTTSINGLTGALTNLSIYNATTSINGLTGALTNLNIFDATTTLSAGSGITVSNGGIGATTVTNNGVLSLVAGSGITVSSATGTVTLTSTGGTASYWTAPTSSLLITGSSSMTLTDTSNLNLFDKVLSRGTVFKWVAGGYTKMAMVATSTYSANVVTLNLIGDTFSIASSSIATSGIKYATEKVKTINFAVAGNLATSTDIAGHYYIPYDMKIFGADAFLGTAGTGGNNVLDIRYSSTTSVFGTAPTIASAASSTFGQTASDNASTTFLANQTVQKFFSLNITGQSVTNAVDGYLNLFVFPLQNVNLP